MSERFTDLEVTQICNVIRNVTGLTVKEHQIKDLEDYFAGLKHRVGDVDFVSFIAKMQK